MHVHMLVTVSIAASTGFHAEVVRVVVRSEARMGMAGVMP
jgi:hypothetical protein